MKLLYPLLCALAGALLFYVLRPVANLPHDYAVGTVVLTHAQIEAGKPKPEAPKGLAKITTKRADLELSALASDAAREPVEKFYDAVAATLAHDSANSAADPVGGSGETSPADTLPRPQCFSDAHTSDGQRLTIWLVCSDLAARKLVYRAPGVHSARVDGDSVVVTYPRFTGTWRKAKDAALIGSLLYIGLQALGK